MNKTALTAIFVAALVTVGGGITYAAVHKSNVKKAADHSLAMQKEVEGAKMMHDEAMKKDDEAALMTKDETSSTKTSDAMMTKGSFSDYDTTKLANAEKGRVVLFFSASWCPTCQEANKNFEASTPPEGLTLLKVNYDKSNDLKKKYGVTYQHTFVQVDKNGSLIKKWSGSTTYDQLKVQLN